MTQPAEKKSKLTLPPDAAPSGQSTHISDIENSFTAKKRQDLLEATVKNWDTDPEPDAVPVRPVPIAPEVVPPADNPERGGVAWVLGKIKTLEKWTILKSAVALLVALVFGWLPFQRLIATTSAEAVVNARVITIRAPIDGEVSARVSNFEVGIEFPAGDELLTINNSRADQTYLDNLKRTKEQLITTAAALQAKKRVLEHHSNELAVQKERYRFSRVAQLEKRISEIETGIVGAKAQREVTEKALARARTLVTSGNIAEAVVDRAVRDDRVALEAINGLQERRKATLVELEAAQKGTFVSDGYNDTSESAQRGLDVELQLADVDARLAGTARELANVNRDLVEETKRHEKLSAAVIRPSFSGRVWEVMTAPDEHVNAGQELVRLLDCNSTIVTASVSESVYQKLRIGQRATFRPSTDGKDLQGWIVGLTGLAAGASNNAIQQGMLSREPYHVTLKFPGLAGSSNCQISRSGLVTFDTTSPVEASTAKISDGQ
jgi:multidrug resistance efflux pump